MGSGQVIQKCCDNVHSSVCVCVVGGGVVHVGLATTVARPICDKNHRLAMYQVTVTMYSIHSDKSC